MIDEKNLNSMENPTSVRDKILKRLKQRYIYALLMTNGRYFSYISKHTVAFKTYHAAKKRMNTSAVLGSCKIVRLPYNSKTQRF